MCISGCFNLWGGDAHSCWRLVHSLLAFLHNTPRIASRPSREKTHSDIQLCAVHWQLTCIIPKRLKQFSSDCLFRFLDCLWRILIYTLKQNHLVIPSRPDDCPESCVAMERAIWRPLCNVLLASLSLPVDWGEWFACQRSFEWSWTSVPRDDCKSWRAFLMSSRYSSWLSNHWSSSLESMCCSVGKRGQCFRRC